MERALSILAQAGSGLDAAHARDLVHRDVKPANIMVDSGPGPDAPEIAYVTDFGLIKNVQSGGRPTPTGEFLGTIDYVAPEQIEGRPVDGRTDIYSLGCVAYECFTGRVPFDRENDAAILWAHIQEGPPSAAAENPALPPGVDEALARAMAKRPADRYGSCAELVAGLRDELESDTARRASLTLPLKRTPPGGRRSPRARLGALLLGLLLGAGVASAALLATRDGGPEAATVTQATTVSQTVTAPAQSRLSAAIPETLRDRCDGTQPPTPDFDESFTCRPGRGVDLVRYSHALSGPLLTEYFIRRLNRQNIPAPEPGERIRQIGSCASFASLPAVEEWNQAGRAGHDPVGRSEFGNSDGRVLCFMAGDKAGIEWITVRLGYYAYAEAKNYFRLFEWWRNEAGPIG